MDETEATARLAKYRRDELTKRQRLEDEERYGPLADRRRGRVQVTEQIMYGMGLLPLPRMTRVVGLQGTENPLIWELVVESPDIPPPAEDGTLPLLDLDAKLHSLSRDRAVPCMSVVQYVATAAWKDRPETRAATTLFGCHGALEKQRSRLLEEADRVGPDGAFSPSLKALREVEKRLIDAHVEVKSWFDVVAAIDEAQAREMLATMLQSFWGEWKR